MDFSVIFQLRTKKLWWMDVIFYFVISLFIAVVLCYLIFLIKNSFLRQDIIKEIAALETVGTEQQREQEESVINYQSKIKDFADLLNNYEFASNVFAFVQAQTRSNVWFKQFVLDKKSNTVQLSGEADDMDTFSRQIATLENEDNKKYVKSVVTLNSVLGASARMNFTINLMLDQNIFSYLSNTSSIFEIIPPPEQEESTPPTSEQQNPPQETLSSEKLITSFSFLLNPEVIGIIDEANHTVTLNVPYGTDVKNLTPTIIISPEATVSPASNVSQNFTNPVAYRVTAKDSSVQIYEAKVIVAARPETAKKPSQSGFIILIVIVGIIAVAAVIFLFFWKKQGQKIKF